MMMQSTTNFYYRAHNKKRAQFIQAIMILFPELDDLKPLGLELLLFVFQHRLVLGELIATIRTNTDLLISAATAFIELMRLVNGILNLCMWCYVAAEWCYVGFERLMMPQYGRV